MSIKSVFSSFAIAAATLGVCHGAQAQFATTLKVSGVSRAVQATHAPGDEDRLFIVMRTGYIKIYNLETETLNSDYFLNIASQVYDNQNEQGLLGLAFHPNYQENGYFYVYYTSTSGSGDTYVRRYSRDGDDPDHATTSGSLTLLTADQPYWNHNGGWLGFSPVDGYLYIGLGDGGSGGDPGNRAQDITNQRMGKMLRIDVDNGSPYSVPADNPFVGTTGDDEIWAYGLRNPWRNCFDSETGDLWIADVGQNAWEEVNFEAAGDDGGRNYGWKCMEGDHCYASASGCTCNSSALTDPIFEYAHNNSGGYSITGGDVYRGCAMPEQAGTYFCGDYVTGNYWAIRRQKNGSFTSENIRSQLSPSIEGFSLGGLSAFGTDARGEVYICSHSQGRVYKIIPDAGEVDCDYEPPVNDECDGAIALSDGVNEFTTIDSNDSDFGVPLGCSTTNGPDLLSDTWYTYQAPCLGTVRINSCGSSDFDARIAVYSVNGCPDGNSGVYACGDDNCGTDFDVEFLALAGQEFKIRIGSADGNTGSGQVSVQCTPFEKPCPADLNDDGFVDGGDLGILLSQWDSDGPADLNEDGTVNGGDLGLLLTEFGPC